MVDCVHMQKDFGLPIGASVPGGKGFLSIRSNHALDVVVVYTSTKVLKVRPPLSSVKIPVGITNNLDVEYIQPIVIKVHDPAISSFHSTGISTDHDGATSGRIHDAAVSTFHETGSSTEHDPNTSGGFHDTALSTFHASLGSEQHNSATSGPILGPQVLYSITHEGFYDTNEITWLRVINPTDATTVSKIPVTYPGETVKGGMGLATDPLTGQLYALLRLGTTHRRDLVKIDPANGVAVHVETMTQTLKGLEFNPVGTLYTMAPDTALASNPGMTYPPALPGKLFSLDSAQPVCGLSGGGNYGDVLAFNTNDGFLYHVDGDGLSGFQRVIDTSVDPCVTEALGTSGTYIDYPWAMTYWEAEGVFLVADYVGDLFRLSPLGVQTLIGSLDDDAHGLTFGPAPAHDSAVSDFHIAAISPNHDGFTSGHDTAVSDFHITGLSSDHDSFTSGRIHESSVSTFHSLYFSSVHDGFSNFLPIHDSPTTGIHDSSASEIHDGGFSFTHEPFGSRFHDSAFTNYHEKNFSFGTSHDGSASSFHDSFFTAIHDGSLSDFHDGLLSFVHDLSTSAFHDGSVSDFHDGDTSGPFHFPDVSDFHLADISPNHDGFLSFRFDHDTLVSDFHLGDISDNHDGFLSLSTHDTSLSTFHEINFSSDHDGVFTDLHSPDISDFHLADISPNHDVFNSFAIGHDPSLSFFHIGALSSEHDGFFTDLHDPLVSDSPYPGYLLQPLRLYLVRRRPRHLDLVLPRHLPLLRARRLHLRTPHVSNTTG